MKKTVIWATEIGGPEPTGHLWRWKSCIHFIDFQRGECHTTATDTVPQFGRVKDYVTLVTCPAPYRTHTPHLIATFHTPTSTHLARTGMLLQEGGTEATLMVLCQCSSHKYIPENIATVSRLWATLPCLGGELSVNKHINKSYKQLQYFFFKQTHLKSHRGKLNTFLLTWSSKSIRTLALLSDKQICLLTLYMVSRPFLGYMSVLFNEYHWQPLKDTHTHAHTVIPISTAASSFSLRAYDVLSRVFLASSFNSNNHLKAQQE